MAAFRPATEEGNMAHHNWAYPGFRFAKFNGNHRILPPKPQRKSLLFAITRLLVSSDEEKAKIG